MNCFGTINFVKITKQSLYKANSFACSLANRDKPLAATLQRKCFGGILFGNYKNYYKKIIVPRHYFVIISARMVHLLGKSVGQQTSCVRFRRAPFSVGLSLGMDRV